MKYLYLPNFIWEALKYTFRLNLMAVSILAAKSMQQNSSSDMAIP